MTGYRERFLASYISSHLGTFRSISSKTLAQDALMFRRRLRRFLPQDRGSAVLDLGCGYGSLLHFVQSQGFANATGIDLSAEQVETARSLGVRNVEVAEAGTFLRGHPASYDLILAFDLIEHFAKDEVVALFDLVRAAPRPSGRIVLRVPNGDSPFASWIRYADFTHEVIFTPTSIRQLLRVTGFSDIEVHPWEPAVHGPASALRWVLRRGMEQVMRLYFLIDQGTMGSGVFTSNLMAVGRRGGDG